MLHVHAAPLCTHPPPGQIQARPARSRRYGESRGTVARSRGTHAREFGHIVFGYRRVDVERAAVVAHVGELRAEQRREQSNDIASRTVQVGCFADIGGKVVQLAFHRVEFPVAHSEPAQVVTRSVAVLPELVEVEHFVGCSGAGLAGDHGEHVFTVDDPRLAGAAVKAQFAGDFTLHQVGDSGVEINCAEHLAARAADRDSAGPAHDTRHAVTTLVVEELSAAQRPCAAALVLSRAGVYVHVGARVEPRAVVGVEAHECVAGQAGVVDRIEDTADRGVHRFHRVLVVAFIQHHVGCRETYPEHERRGGVAVDEVDGSGGGSIGTVGVGSFRTPSVETVLGEFLVELRTKMALADNARGVALGLEDLADRVLVRVHALAGRYRLVDADPVAVAAGEETGASRRADGCPRVEIGEPRALRSHLVEARREDVRAAVAAHVAVPLIVGHDHDEVWLARRAKAAGKDVRRESGSSTYCSSASEKRTACEYGLTDGHGASSGSGTFPSIPGIRATGYTEK